MKPRLGGNVVAAWLAGIVVNLLIVPGFYDIALRDFGLFVGAVALARQATAFTAARTPGRWYQESSRPGLASSRRTPPNDNNNQLAGTPTSAGTFAFRMRVTDGREATATGRVSVTIN